MVIPPFIWEMILSLVLKLGVQFVFQKWPWLKTRFPALAKILEEYLKNSQPALGENTDKRKLVAREVAGQQFIALCQGKRGDDNSV